MNKLFTLLLLLAFGNSHGQAYFPFPLSNALWTERHAISEAMVDYQCYGLKEDSILVAGVSYRKLYRSADSILDASEYCGGLREAGKRIYYYDAGSKSERLLYDFSVRVGDTVMPGGMGAKGIVSSIDSMLISGVYRKRFNFQTFYGTPCFSGSWVEGLGNTNFGGLLGSVLMEPTCDCGSRLICFKEKNTYVYHNPRFAGMDCFGPVLAIPDVGSGLQMSLISPNPIYSTGYFSNTANFRKMVIYSITGRQVSAIDLEPGQSVSIRKEDYPSGIYFYQLSGGTAGTFTAKLVIQ